jgi:ribosomal protein S12
MIIRFGLLLLAISFAMGCSDGRLKTYPVRGKAVFKDGSPVKVGTVECKSTSHGVQATGAIQQDGTFTLTTYRENDGAVAGEHHCVLVQFVMTENIPNYRPSTLGVVNKKYNTYASSDLSMTVDPNKSNEIELVVEGVAPLGRSTNDHGHAPIEPPTLPSGQ